MKVRNSYVVLMCGEHFGFQGNIIDTGDFSVNMEGHGNIMYLVIGLLIPFLGTATGAASVFFIQKNSNVWMKKGLPGFASGVMTAASIWSLLIPAIEMAEKGHEWHGILGRINSVTPASLGFVLGIVCLLLFERIVPGLMCILKRHTKICGKVNQILLLMLAVTLHNIPEGMAVGITYAGVLQGEQHMTIASAIALSIGIAIQNFPEGAIISMSFQNRGEGKKKAFFYGVLSGAVEPAAAAITILLTGMAVPLLPYFLAFAAGAMIYVVVNELLPETSKDGKTQVMTIGFAVGFLVMMILDVVLG